MYVGFFPWWRCFLWVAEKVIIGSMFSSALALASFLECKEKGM